MRFINTQKKSQSKLNSNPLLKNNLKEFNGGLCPNDHGGGIGGGTGGGTNNNLNQLF